MNIFRQVIDLIRDEDTQLPTLPMVVQNVLTVAHSDRATADDLANVISKAPAIAAKTLKLVNSSYYGFANRVDSISRAVTLMGVSEIVSLTVGTSVFTSFPKKSGQLVMRDLWLHAIATAMTAKMIAKRISHPAPERVFLAGLLHDIGKVVLDVYFSKDYEPVLLASSEQTSGLYVLEKEHLGIDHAKLAGLLITKWQFPNSLRYPVRYHHEWERCPPAQQKDAMLLALANLISTKAAIGGSGNLGLPKHMPNLKGMGLTPYDMDDFLQKIRLKRGEMEFFLETML